MNESALPQRQREEPMGQSILFLRGSHDSKDDMQASKLASKHHVGGQKLITDRRQRTNSSNKGDTAQPLGEEHLFELLIEKVKQREENEAVAAAIQRKLETQNGRLKAQNRELRCQLDTFHAELQKSSLESKEYQAQMEGWKFKIQKFKNAFNELGHEYEILRVEARKFQEIAVALGKEKGDLTEAINQIRVQVLRAEEIAANQQVAIFQDQQSIALLEQALVMSKAKENDTNTQLSDQKRQTVLLESHIQNSTQAQVQQLNLVRNEQLKLLERLGEGLKIVSHDSMNFKEILVSQLQAGFDECRLTVQSLADKLSAEQLDVKGFATEVHDVSGQ
ncbi:hypothetical protein N7495_004100 [Penicillium taxi]|uniref:uncharacterized protein n=1 Tax=Penicillium taxi TaxID=168475 RepID=UPI002545545F|nr:uncharacterized protein N7495_004100 [Penicillium taxi]KAJ5899356.1 hypothetical protein N7495_004100 [Penicillium taxi]